ncbi:Cyclin-dependent protein kinase inhibitor SMR3 [Camellia lanceoleosa]|uniref:Cyclin-dependent protein kinase inhibitor SMR3 n=1 Tax=Camellia lanceoleosa TaxID=1840588 RepID=A0ACC0HP00_9ERIC|nr:Cyclin-dependent protein kinase inhibitor SMR3 [Camellia lanceoleosa]
MFTDFNHISYVGMTSTSNSNPDTLNLKNDKKQTESKISSPPTSEFPDGSQSTDSNLDNPDHENGKEEEKSEVTASFDQKLKSEAAVVDDDDDGFKTPTSLDHKIPVNTECPPAPKRRRKSQSSSQSLKRKATTTELDLKEEIELLLFAPTIRDDLDRKIKKARRDDSTE